ncbi:hypothetical protein G8S55_07250 [Clostridium botulinum C]|uniref:hypothetical protein n=1 Tax=Clostridium botulinum TaxID=1491 RepID=UPI001E5C2207|nr:hypothetical protein [Clostridium botulinum]MCD3217050.1 hypothetical protein [Clostridium botulinum C]MCD3244865.1 hypothetical protein [Clostridium botulinum C]MCD3261575.1 hypothetical protein [Clostridium botulinum C]
MVNKDVIPLYVNDNLINNLFTVVVQEFKETMTLTTRSHQVVKIDTPLGNVIKGKYVQGRFNVELFNEYSRQMTTESISVIVWAFLQTRDILNENNLLKHIVNSNDVSSIQPEDYIEVKCRLNKNPQIRQIEDLIQCLKMKQIFDCDSKVKFSEVIPVLSDYLQHLKQEHCLKYYTDGICGTNFRGIIPIQMKYMQDNINYLNDFDVTIMGKVLKTAKKGDDHNINLYGGTCYDYLTQKYIEEFKKKYLEHTDLMDEKVDRKIINECCPLIEIVPLAMYI